MGTDARSPPSILVVYGTRPEAIKLAPVIASLRGRAEVVVCATGQHREMVAQVEELFDLRPDLQLGLMREQQPLNQLAGRVLEALDAVLARRRFDWLVVQGDTTTALAGALAAFHRQQPVAHVEAGLRSGSLERPFPEEANRRVVDLLSTVLFAPTERAARALEREGCEAARIHLTGNTIVDALESLAPRLEREEGPAPGAPREVLVTLHRRESHGVVLEGLLAALARIAGRHPDLRFCFPVHHSPAVLEPSRRLLGGLPNVELAEPYGYRRLLQALRRARLVLTDSGGIQEEAPSFGVPVLVLRDTTERPEGIEAGVARLAGTDPAVVEGLVEEELAGGFVRRATVNPYGDGRAAERIADVLAPAREEKAPRGH